MGNDYEECPARSAPALLAGFCEDGVSLLRGIVESPELTVEEKRRYIADMLAQVGKLQQRLD